MEKIEQFVDAVHWHHIKLWVAGGFLIITGLTFLGKPSSPSILIADKEGRLGVIEANQFKTTLDEPLPGYVLWSRPEGERQRLTLDEIRQMLRTVDNEPWLWDRGGLNWFDRSPAKVARDMSTIFDRRSTAEEARELSIWRNDTRNGLVTPIPLPSPISIPPPVPFSVAPLPTIPVTLPLTRIHIARIPPREAKPKSVGHVKPNSDREAIWLRSIPLDLIPLNARTGFGKAETKKSSRARELEPNEYLIGWLFVLTRCHPNDDCKLVANGEAACLTPETLSDHVLGMTHVVIPRTYLYVSKENDSFESARASGADILQGGGLTLLTGADYDYVSLRVSHYRRGVRQPSDIDDESDSSATSPSQTREYSIAMLDERLHEIVAMINRANDLNPGDPVLILPTAFDLQLDEDDYLIVGLDDIPPPLRSHYRAGAVPEKVAKSSKKQTPRRLLAGPTAQSRKPAARISAAVDE